MNFRRKSSALAPRRERFVSPPGGPARLLLLKHLPGENPPWRADRARSKPRELIKKILAAGAGPAQVSIGRNEPEEEKAKNAVAPRPTPHPAPPGPPRPSPAAAVGPPRGPQRPAPSRGGSPPPPGFPLPPRARLLPRLPSSARSRRPALPRPRLSPSPARSPLSPALRPPRRRSHTPLASSSHFSPVHSLSLSGPSPAVAQGNCFLSWGPRGPGPRSRGTVQGSWAPPPSGAYLGPRRCRGGVAARAAETTVSLDVIRAGPGRGCHAEWRPQRLEEGRRPRPPQSN